MKNGIDQNRTRVGVIGIGAVGEALVYTLSWFHEVIPYDKKGSYAFEPILSADLILVCVDTPQGPDGRLDCKNVRDVLARLQAGGFGGVVVVRSTVHVGFMDQATRAYPKLHLVYFPEFIRERSRLPWTVCPDRLVVAGDQPDIRALLRVFDWVEDVPVLQMSFVEAELGKLAHNAFIATKVSFTNEIERISEKYGADPDNVMRVVIADRRVKSSAHLVPRKGTFNGRCVPKDTHELLLAGDGSALLEAVEEVKEEFDQRERQKSARSIIEQPQRSSGKLPASNGGKRASSAPT